MSGWACSKKSIARKVIEPHSLNRAEIRGADESCRMAIRIDDEEI